MATAVKVYEAPTSEYCKLTHMPALNTANLICCCGHCSCSFLAKGKYEGVKVSSTMASQTRFFPHFNRTVQV